ncbi:lipoprotein [Pontibacter pamirensis]
MHMMNKVIFALTALLSLAGCSQPGEPRGTETLYVLYLR